MATWPTTLPQFVSQEGYTQTLVDPVLRTESDAGPQKTRLRYTSVPEKFTISLVLTRTQLPIFTDSFFKNELGYGSLTFIWVHPVTREVAPRCRFEGPYNIAPHGVDFTVTINMEILP